MTVITPSVGIVGGGIAGLYAALHLLCAGYRVHIFESTDRIGGRIQTHYFNDEENQYFEAGAMRIPKHRDASSTTPRSINWALLEEETRAQFQDRTAEDLMLEAVSPLLQKLRGNFNDGFDEICREFDQYSFRFYLSSILGWPTDVI